ncbi:MAG: HAMP domain-containing protein [Myxococcales bacterium]|nr:HAMP domain-containing protein [Myxococcales bacterium]
MRLGIRAQLLVSMAALLLLAFAPLFFAVASLARASFDRAWEMNARELGRAIAGHVGEAKRHRPAALPAMVEAQTGEGVGAIGVYDAAGALELAAGDEAEALPRQLEPAEAQSTRVTLPHGVALLVVVPGDQGAVAALLVAEPSVSRVAPLVRSVALYIGLLGLALLVFAYLVLGRLVVTPVVRLARAAERVAEGGRELTAPTQGGQEIVLLGQSLATMTSKLRAEEAALREKVTELEATTDELRRAQATVVRSERLASVGRLSAGLAHEIGNPIAAILALQELVLDGELDEEQRDLVERMHRESNRVSKILRDLLDFARPTNGLAADEPVSASLREVVEQVSALVAPQKSFRNVDLAVELSDRLPPVAMDAGRLEQVLLNLLLNAADVVPDDGGRVRLAAKEAGDRVVVEVEDNGGGIAPEVRERLFEPFVTTKDVGEGTGLGLAVCRGLVEGVGGTIEAQEGEAGARFVLELPIAERA